MPRKTSEKISVLLSPDEFDRFDAFCRDRGFKKSTLIARLIRQYLDLEGYNTAPRDQSSAKSFRSSTK
jgi:hypothetical protein